MSLLKELFADQVADVKDDEGQKDPYIVKYKRADGKTMTARKYAENKAELKAYYKKDFISAELDYEKMNEGITPVDPDGQYVIKLTKTFDYTGPGKKVPLDKPRVSYFAGKKGRDYSWGASLKGAEVFDTMSEVSKMMSELDREDFMLYPNGGSGKAAKELKHKMEAVLLSNQNVDEAFADASGMMPLSYKPSKGDTTEAYGRIGMKNKQFRKFFKSTEAMNKWADDNDATIEGTAELDSADVQPKQSHFEYMLKNEKTVRFLAKDREDAVKQAKDKKAISLIKVSQNGMPIGKPISLKEDALEIMNALLAEGDDALQGVDAETAKEVSDALIAFASPIEESAEYAKKLVRGEKHGPGILNKLSQWFKELINDTVMYRGKKRFLSAVEAKDQLKRAGFSDHQISLVRDAAAKAGYAALERMKTKYPNEIVVPKHFVDNASAFQVADLYLNVGEDIREEFAEAFQRLFDLKMKKIESKLEIVKESKAEKLEGWYVYDKNEKCVAGPLGEQQAKKKAEALGGDEKGYVTGYTSDYAVKRANEGKAFLMMPSGVLIENTELQDIGKALKNKAPVEAEEDDVTAVNTPPAEKTEVDAEAAVETEVEQTPEFKVGDIVSPTKGPHKGQRHEIIHVFPDGSMNIKPKDLAANAVKYRLGAAKAQPEDVVLSEGAELSEGWKKENPKSQEKTNRDREGRKVSTPDGPGTVKTEYKIPTFSQMVPYMHEIMVKLDSGESKMFPAKVVKFDKVSEAYVDNFKGFSLFKKGAMLQQVSTIVEAKKAVKEKFFRDFDSWLIKNNILDEDESYEIVDSSYNSDTYTDEIVGKFKKMPTFEKLKKEIKGLADFTIQDRKSPEAKNAIKAVDQYATEHAQFIIDNSKQYWE